MCRSIKVLRRPEAAATPEETYAASLQFVRKISGFRQPSKANQEAFERAVREISESSKRLLETLPTPRRAAVEPAVNPEIVAPSGRGSETAR